MEVVSKLYWDDFSIWKKGENLILLRDFQNSSIYKVPEFRCVWEKKENLQETINYFHSIWVEFVSVRSSSENEDTENDSKAWVFKTYLDIPVDDIEQYIDLVQQHSLEKSNECIPVVIQKMVDDIEFAWVAFSTSPDDDKPYIVLNYHNGIWEDIVSGSVSWKTYKILKWINSISIENSLHKDVFNSLSYLQDKLQQSSIDIEFAYSKWILYLLQVRPITTPKNEWIASKLALRYASFVSNTLSKDDSILWNMIDINPEELVWNSPQLIQSFFKYIFPDTSLIEARKSLWYSTPEDFFHQIAWKPFVELWNNIKNFLPNTLDDREQEVFISYYTELIKNNPELQNQLDSVLYPNTIEIVKNILEDSQISVDSRENILIKFNVFFESLNLKFIELTSHYSNIEKDLLNQVGVENFLELAQLKEYTWSLDELVSIIKKSTYYFTIYGRIFFFESQKWLVENHDFFEKNFYTNKIKKSLLDLNMNDISFNIPEGFNFLNLLNQNIDNKNYPYGSLNISGNVIDISKVWRENIKFIFMQLFRLLWKKISCNISEFWISLEEIQNINFNSDFLDIMLSQNISRKTLRLDYFNRKALKYAKIREELNIPSILLKGNNLIENTNFDNIWFFIWKWILAWEVIYAEKISDLLWIDCKWKIIVLENATPEIDIYLWKIKGIITKNGWPLSHIAIRSRELNVPAVVWTSYYKELLWANKPNFITINFDNNIIQY